MSLKDFLEPENTEEVRPGFFLQKSRKGYSQINPLVWKGKWRTREQLRTIISWRFLFTIVLVFFIAWSYWHDVSELREFQEEVVTDTRKFCTNYFTNTITPQGSNFLNEDSFNVPIHS